MSATATLLSFSTTTPLEPVAPPAVMTRSGRFSPRRRVPSNKQERSAYLAGLLIDEPPALLAPPSPPASPTCVMTAAFAPTTTTYHRQSKQKVRFDWKLIVHQDERRYDDDDDDDMKEEEDGNALWYSANDIARMRQEYQDLALALREQAKLMSQHDTDNNNNNNSTHWQEALRRVYQTAARAAHVDDLAAVLLPQPKTVVVPADLTGLEMASVTYIQLDTVSRKHCLYERVQICQAAVRDPAVRADMLRQCSRTLSRPARLTARYVAVLSSSLQQQQE